MQTEYFTNKLVTDICSYINFLVNTYDYHISIHQLEQYSSEGWFQLLKYNYHQTALCREIKCSQRAWQHCIDRQGKVIRALDQCPHLGTCYAGVTEYVIPLLGTNGKPCSFLCVSGYVQDWKAAKERATAAALNYNLPKERLLSAVQKLRPVLPDYETIAAQFSPLQDMFAFLFYLNNSEYKPDKLSNSQENFYMQILHMANREFRDREFSLKTVCEKLNCNYSYASHIFSQYNKCSFSAYLRQLRIESAKKRLEYTTESISQIAHMAGFGDTNYFSSVFRQETGLTPTKWRERYYHINIL